MRRQLRKMLLGAGLFVLLLTPEQCAIGYCFRHNFFPPICDLFVVLPE